MQNIGGQVSNWGDFRSGLFKHRKKKRQPVFDKGKRTGEKGDLKNLSLAREGSVELQKPCRSEVAL